MAAEKKLLIPFCKNDKVFFLVLVLILIFFSLTSLYSFLLFHTLSELFSIVIAAAIFIIAWNSRDYIDNNYLLFIGIAFLFIGGIDFIHTLAYKGMNIFTGFDADLPTQLWIAGRYLEAGTLIAAALLISCRVNVYKEFFLYLTIFLALLISIFEGIFPVCYIEGQGLTGFKIFSEYIICLMLALSIYLLYKRRENFEPKIFSLIIIAIFFTILSELAFTFYVGVYGFSNLIGHLFKIVAFALIYYALVETGIRRPYEIIFRNLDKKEKEAAKERDTLNMYLNTAGVLLMFVDNDGIVRRINKKGCEILGYEENEITGKNFSAVFIHPDKSEDECCTFSEFIGGYCTDKKCKGNAPVEYDVLTKSGQRKTLLWQISLIYDSGEKKGTFISGEDITGRKSAESKLLRTQFAFDHSPDEIYFVNSEGEIIYSNKSAERSFGINPKSPEKTTIFDINPEFKPERWKELWAEILAKGSKRFESVHIHSDGTKYPVDIIEHLIRPDGTEYACTISRDITEKKKEENILRENEAYLRTLINTIPDLVWLKDEEGRFLACNKNFERLLGAQESGVLGKTDYDFVDKEIADYFRKYDNIAIEAEKPVINEEWVTYADDGHKAYLETIKTPMTDSDGKLLGVLGIGRDITRRKEMEDNLRKKATELKKFSRDLSVIIDNAPAMIWYKDTDNNIIRINPKAAETTGLSVKEIGGKNTRDLFPSYAEKYYNDDLKVIRSKKPKLGIIEQMITAAGENLWVSTDKIPLMDENGDVYGLLAFVTDITGQKKTQDALKEVNRKLNLLSSITRHDILNQITGAAGYLEIIGMNDEIPKGSKAEEHIQKISEAVGTIEKQINFTGYYKDLGEQEPRWFDVGRTIDRVREDLDSDRVELKNNVSDIKIFADPLFEKVIYNLIDNAVKHGDKITEISFYTEEKPGELIIICEDDGVGIPDEYKEKIFRREYYKNSGLGLFLSREILAINDLTITGTGTLGEGARFELHFSEDKFRSNGDAKN
ncbi:MAG: MASE3 domain-containing protein [Methanomicrobium sp.]|nr:MASE3 domain-containing protein [Methanomicrobium sp.]